MDGEIKPKDPQVAAAYERLLKVRGSKTVKFKGMPTFIRDSITGLDGESRPFNLRYYQVQGVYHFLEMPRMILGDGTGTGKTCQQLTAFSFLWAKTPETKVIVVCPKSAMRQWASEVEKFTTGIQTFVVSGSATKRAEIYRAWQNAPTGPDDPKSILVINYAILVRDWSAGATQPRLPNGRINPKGAVTPGLLDGITSAVPELIVTYDECSAFKNPNTKTWQVCQQLSVRAKRVYGLSATILKNKLEEGFAIFKVIVPGLFTTKTKFYDLFCVTKLQPVRGGRQVPIVVGYKNLDLFRSIIDPYFYGRPKHVISDELPRLITKEVTCELGKAEDAKYTEALSGVLMLGDGEMKDYEEHKAFVSLIYCQQVVNSMSLLDFKENDEVDVDMFAQEQATVAGKGAKEQTLLDILEEELTDEKVIIYTRFESWVERLQDLVGELGIKSVRVTGKEGQDQRQAAMEAFQDLKSDVRIVFITNAGSEAINLQAASAMIFMDAPWSWGDYVQLLGRPIRIGSVNQHVVVYHIVAERPRSDAKQRKTIDHHTLKLLHRKKDLVDRVLGESAVGALDFGSTQSFAKELVDQLQGK